MKTQSPASHWFTLAIHLAIQRLGHPHHRPTWVTPQWTSQDQHAGPDPRLGRATTRAALGAVRRWIVRPMSGQASASVHFCVPGRRATSHPHTTGTPISRPKLPGARPGQRTGTNRAGHCLSEWRMACRAPSQFENRSRRGASPGCLSCVALPDTTTVDRLRWRVLSALTRAGVQVTNIGRSQLS